MDIPDFDPVAAPPVRITADGVLRDVYAARWATQDHPPRLAAALARAALAVDDGDVEALDYAYREIAVAAMSNLSRIRAAYPELRR